MVNLYPAESLSGGSVDIVSSGAYVALWAYSFVLTDSGFRFFLPRLVLISMVNGDFLKGAQICLSILSG